jgi:C1A family cysteine protease
MTKRNYALIPDKTDLRDQIFKTTKSVHTLASTVDLRSKMSPVVDQGQLGSCSANAICSGLREYLELKKNVSFVALSRLYLYWHERDIEGTIGKDAGAQIRDGMAVLKKLGVCPEADFPYEISTYNDTPKMKAETDAAAYKIVTYSRVNDLTMLKTSLAEEYPVVIGFKVYSSFESGEVAATGQVPMPQVGEEFLGGHAVLAVGYDDLRQVVICKNSWGLNWGDHGYFYLPYGYWEKKYVDDMWTGNV